MHLVEIETYIRTKDTLMDFPPWWLGKHEKGFP